MQRSPSENPNGLAKAAPQQPAVITVQGTPSQRPAAHDGDVAHGEALHVTRLPFDAFRARIAEVRGLAERTVALLPGLRSIPDTERTRFGGYLRAGEDKAIASVLAAAAVRPELCNVLAVTDGSGSPAVFRVDVLRGKLAMADDFDALADHYASLSQQCRDTGLVLRAQVREPTMDAYEILRVAARHDPNIRSALKPAIDFFAKIARKGAKTRATADAEADGSEPTPEKPQ